MGASIGPHPQYEVCCVIDLANRVVSFEKMSAEMVTSVKGVSDDVIQEVNLLRTAPQTYLTKLVTRSQLFIDDYVFKKSDGSKIRLKEGKKGIHIVVIDESAIIAVDLKLTSWLNLVYYMCSCSGSN